MVAVIGGNPTIAKKTRISRCASFVFLFYNFIDMRNTIASLLLGIVVVFFAGTFLHFAFDIFGRVPYFAPIAAVNESVWEHLKLLFFPFIGYALIERKYKKEEKGYWFGKLVGSLIGMLFVVVAFYGYTFFVGHSVLGVDIAIFAICVVLAFISAHFISVSNDNALRNMIGMAGIAIFILLFSIFTFFPPRIPIFKDNNTYSYGASFR